MKKKKYYSKEFKEKTVSLSYQRENLKELADELGINVQRIYRWRSVANPRIPSKVRSCTTSDFRRNTEVQGLKKQLKETRLELEILKKALHIFSKSDGKPINL